MQNLSLTQRSEAVPEAQGDNGTEPVLKQIFPFGPKSAVAFQRLVGAEAGDATSLAEVVRSVKQAFQSHVFD